MVSPEGLDPTSRGSIAGAGLLMVIRPPHHNPFEFVVICALRAQQLLAGCRPSISGEHSCATMAQMEVAGGKVVRAAERDSSPSWKVVTAS